MQLNQPIETATGGQYLTFLLGGEEYAISILKVKEILEFETVTAVPNTPTWVRGVLNLRGRVVPVIDLATKFGMPALVPSKLTCIVVTEVENDNEVSTIGVMADEVCQVIELQAGDIESAPSFGTKVRTEFLEGMGKIGKKFCLILNNNKVLSTDELLAAVNTGDLQVSAPVAETVTA